MAHFDFVQDFTYPLPNARLSGNMATPMSGILICRPMWNANQPEALVPTLAWIPIMVHFDFVRDFTYPLLGACLSGNMDTPMSGIFICRPMWNANQHEALVPTLTWIPIMVHFDFVRDFTYLLPGTRLSRNMATPMSGILICRPMQDADQHEALVTTLSGKSITELSGFPILLIAC